MQAMRRFAKYWDLIGNSGNFPDTLDLILRDEPSAFQALRRIADFLWQCTGMVDGIALLKLTELLFRWLTNEKHLPPNEVAPVLWADYTRPGRHGDKPPRWLASFLAAAAPSDTCGKRTGEAAPLPRRQARHTRPSIPAD
jgi:hypothetical protein